MSEATPDLVELKPHLSHTQLEKHAACPEAYRRAYIERERTPAGLRAATGIAAHQAAEENFRQKIETRRDLPVDDIMDMAAANFEAATADGVHLTRDEQRTGTQRSINEAKDRTIAIAKVLGSKVVKEYQPVLVEHKVRIPLPGPHDLLAVIDLVDEDDLVVDFKTRGFPGKAEDAHHSQQLTIYDAAFRCETGRAPSGLRLEVLSGDVQIRRNKFTTERTDRDFAVLAARVNAFEAAVQTGVFPPAALGTWLCSPKWCPYWSTCPYVNGERRKD